MSDDPFKNSRININDGNKDMLLASMEEEKRSLIEARLRLAHTAEDREWIYKEIRMEEAQDYWSMMANHYAYLEKTAQEINERTGKYPEGYYPGKYQKELNHLLSGKSSPDQSKRDLQQAGVCFGISGGVLACIFYWDSITSAVKTAGEFVLMAGAAAVGTAVTGAVTVGAYKASNFVWDKLTGHSSPLKSGLTTAALFATAVGGVQYARQPAAAERAHTQSLEEFQPGFYKAANGGAYVLEYKNGTAVENIGISDRTCVRVLAARAGQEYAAVEIMGDEKSIFGTGNLYIRKNDLRPAPECRAF